MSSFVDIFLSPNRMFDTDNRVLLFALHLRPLVASQLPR